MFLSNICFNFSQLTIIKRKCICKDNSTQFSLDSSDSTAVEHSSTYPDVEGSNLAPVEKGVKNNVLNLLQIQHVGPRLFYFNKCTIINT
jgi:hypothetical protein